MNETHPPRLHGNYSLCVRVRMRASLSQETDMSAANTT